MPDNNYLANTKECRKGRHIKESHTTSAQIYTQNQVHDHLLTPGCMKRLKIKLKKSKNKELKLYPDLYFI